MKFSEALALGMAEINPTNGTWLYTMQHLPGQNHVADANFVGQECAGCLIGGALYAMGEREIRSLALVRALKKHWPKLTVAKLPEVCKCGEKMRPIAGILRFTSTIAGGPIEFERTDGFPDIAQVCTHLMEHYLGKNTRWSLEEIVDYVRTMEVAEDELVVEEEILSQEEIYEIL